MSCISIGIYIVENKKKSYPPFSNPPVNIIENNKKAGNGWKIKEKQKDNR